MSYLPFVFVHIDVTNDVIVYLHKLNVFLTLFAKLNDSNMCVGGIIVDYRSDFQIYDRLTTAAMS